MNKGIASCSSETWNSSSASCQDSGLGFRVSEVQKNPWFIFGSSTWQTSPAACSSVASIQLTQNSLSTSRDMTYNPTQTSKTVSVKPSENLPLHNEE